MLKDGMRGRGYVHFVLTDENSEIKLDQWYRNMIVNTGLAHIADQLAETPTQAAMSYMSVGSGSTAVVSSDTTLGSELSRVALSTRTAAAAVVTYTATFSAGQGTGTLYEAAIFNASSAGNMLARLVYGIITKASGDTLAITWTLTLADDGA